MVIQSLQFEALVSQTGAKDFGNEKFFQIFSYKLLFD